MGMVRHVLETAIWSRSSSISMLISPVMMMLLDMFFAFLICLLKLSRHSTSPLTPLVYWCLMVSGCSHCLYHAARTNVFSFDFEPHACTGWLFNFVDSGDIYGIFFHHHHDSGLCGPWKKFVMMIIVRKFTLNMVFILRVKFCLGKYNYVPVLV